MGVIQGRASRAFPNFPENLKSLEIRRPLGVNQASEILALLLSSSSLDLPNLTTGGVGVPVTRFPHLREHPFGDLFWRHFLNVLQDLQMTPFGSPNAVQMAPTWTPDLHNFLNCENLDFGDLSHTLEGSRVSDLDLYCILFPDLFLGLF